MIGFSGIASSILMIAVLLPAQQTSVSIHTDSACGAFVRGGGASDFDSVAAGTQIGAYPNSLNVSARVSVATPRTWLFATTLAYPTQPSQDGIGVNFFQRANARGLLTDVSGSTSATGAAGAQPGPAALLLRFSNQPGTQGRIVLSFRCNPGVNGTVGATLDVGNDGSLEVATRAAQTYEVPYTMPASGTVTLRVTSECSVPGRGDVSLTDYAWTEAWIGFRPDRTASCTLTNYGQGCGPQVSASEAVLGANRVVTFLVTGAFPNDPVLAVIGSGPLSLQLPGGCALLSQVEVASLVTADGAGLATYNMVIPAILTGSSWHQFAPVTQSGGSLVLTTTDGVRVDCR